MELLFNLAVKEHVQNIQLLQEEVMEFKIHDIEMLDNEKSTHSYEDFNVKNSGEPSTSLPNSLIMSELHKETEELQNKLKLNYRRLLLFETENNKLLEEKNKLFFEMQNYFQKNQLLSEKNDELEKLKLLAEGNQQLLLEKIDTYEKINKTQLMEIKRFSKFYNKIQDVVKPFIVQLKKEITSLKNELSISKKINTELSETAQHFQKKVDLELTQKTNEIITLHAEKNSLIQTYEEQIHSFSKEILDLQSKNEEAHQEICRLKKAVEFKNYFENEVIRFKRTHEEDQKKITDLSQKKSMLETNLFSLEQSITEVSTENSIFKNKIKDLEVTLEITRTQFSKKIDELGLTNERLARLERLNNQLSQEMSSK